MAIKTRREREFVPACCESEKVKIKPEIERQFQKNKRKTKKCKEEWTKVAVNYVSEIDMTAPGYN